VRRETIMAQYAVLLYAPVSDDDVEPSPEAYEVHERHSEDLQRAGVMALAFALEDPSVATSMRADVVTDGPFLESKEVVLGFYVLDAPDLDAALVIARQNPIHQQGGGVEVRPVASSWIRPH
jgi:hypothetical protein